MGRARDSRASPGAEIVLPFRRDRLPRAVVFHTPSDWRPCIRAFDGSRGGRLATTDTGGPTAAVATSSTPPEARGEQAEVIHRPPRGPPDSPSPGLHRSTTARRHREHGSDALPVDGMGTVCARVFLRHVRDAVGEAVSRDNSGLGAKSMRTARGFAAQQWAKRGVHLPIRVRRMGRTDRRASDDQEGAAQAVRDSGANHLDRAPPPGRCFASTCPPHRPSPMGR